jgi:antitoxin HicB
VIGEDLRAIELGFPLGLPLCRNLGGGLWEVRSTLPTKREARLIFFHQSSEGGLGRGARVHQKGAQNARTRSQAGRHTQTGVRALIAQQRKSRTTADLTTLDQFLEEEGVKDEVNLSAIKRVIALQLEQEIRTKRITKADLARRMHTSRAQVDRVLDPDEGNVTIDTLARAARILGRSIRLELV